MGLYEDQFGVAPDFPSAFAAATALSALGLSQADRLALFSDVVGTQGLRYCPLALELLLADPDEEVPEPPVEAPEPALVVMEAATALVPQEPVADVVVPFEVPPPPPLVDSVPFGVQLAPPGVPGEPLVAFPEAAPSTALPASEDLVVLELPPEQLAL